MAGAEKPGDKEWKCFEFVCPLFPRCERAVSCCGMDDFFADVTLSAAQCCEMPEKPFFIEKKRRPIC